jgi:hypothetical protein
MHVRAVLDHQADRVVHQRDVTVSLHGTFVLDTGRHVRAYFGTLPPPGATGYPPIRLSGDVAMLTTADDEILYGLALTVAMRKVER